MRGQARTENGQHNRVQLASCQTGLPVLQCQASKSCERLASFSTKASACSLVLATFTTGKRPQTCSADRGSYRGRQGSQNISDT